jgi:hypothetical protein
MSIREFLAHIQLYFITLANDGIGLISGIASVLVGFWAAYFPPTAEKAKVVLWVTVALCFFLASFRVWLREHRAFLDEQGNTSLHIRLR